MTKEELIRQLQILQHFGDIEVGHEKADQLLLDYINDADIAEAFLALTRWYA